MRSTRGVDHSFVRASFRGLFLCLLVILPAFFSSGSAESRRFWAADMIVMLSRYARIIN